MKLEDIEVTLERHKGVLEGPVPVEVELPQQVIKVNGVWAGYVNDAPGSPVQIVLSNLPKVVVDEIKRQVDEQRGHASSAVLQAKSLEQSVVKTEETKPANALDEVGL